MKWLGGFADLVAFSDYVERVDARALDEVLIAMAGEADAQRVVEAERKLQGASHGYNS